MHRLLISLLLFIAASGILMAQTPFYSVHISAAEAHESVHPMIGASISIPTSQLFEFRLKADTSIGSSFHRNANDSDSKFNTLFIDCIFHKNGVRKRGFLMGVGAGVNHLSWYHKDYIYYNNDYEWIKTKNSINDSSIFFILGGSFGSHFRLESRLNFSNFSQSDNTYKTSKVLVMIGASWTF